MRINENNYVDKAEEAIKSLVEESKQKCRGKVNIVTTSKIRNLLAMTADIYNQISLGILSKGRIFSRISLLARSSSADTLP